MQGTGYAIAEVIIFLIISAIIGFGIGWLLARWTQWAIVGVDFEEQLTAERDRTRQVEARLGERSRDLDAVRTELTRAKGLLAASSMDMSLGDQLMEAADRIVELEGIQLERDAEIIRLNTALEDLGAARERVSQLEGELGVCKAEVEARQARIAELEASAAGAAEEAEEAEEVPEAEETPVKTAAADVTFGKEEATAKMAEIAARTAGGVPLVDDDLKKVHGIGPKLEQLLKGLGITSFRQVAGFRSEDIAYVAAALESFPGRIVRDDWMSSAAEQHEKKYGEPL